MIERIPYPNPLPTEQNDYVKQNNLIETNFLDMYKAIEVISGNITRGAIFNCGGTIYLATSNTAIAGVASDYVKLTPSADGSVLTASYVANLAGVSWNQVYNGYYDGSSPANLYIFDEVLAVKNGQLSSCRAKLFQSIYNNDRQEVGQVAFFVSSSRVGWLLADGSTIDKSANPEYTDLVDMLKAEAGADVTHPYYSANANEAVLPDIEGRSLRAIDSSGTRDQDGTRKSGNYQADENKEHNHTVELYNGSGSGAVPSNDVAAAFSAAWGSTYSRSINQGNTENTVKNIALYAMIKI